MGVHDAPLIGELGERAHEDLPSNCLPEDLHTQHVGNQLLRLPVHVRMDQRHVVVASDAIPQRRKPLLDSLNNHLQSHGSFSVEGSIIGQKWRDAVETDDIMSQDDAVKSARSSGYLVREGVSDVL